MENNCSCNSKGSKGCSRTRESPPPFFKIMDGDFKHAMVSVVNGRFAFGENWEDFVVDHRIKAGEHVVFTHIPHNDAFDVQIFGADGWERREFDFDVDKGKGIEFRPEYASSKRKKNVIFETKMPPVKLGRPAGPSVPQRVLPKKGKEVDADDLYELVNIEDGVEVVSVLSC